ncbi:MAG: universal stress protein [Haloarculaceae archaeon]
MFESILVPTDGSHHGDQAVRHGIELARAHDAELHLLYVVEPLDVPAPTATELAADRVERGERVLAAHGTATDFEITDAYVARGTPCEVISQYVTDADVDLVIVGLPGESDRGRRLGTTVRRLMRVLDVPVLTLPVAHQ